MAKIVSIHSFRGGTGKSNSTANIAAIVAEKGHQVGIVDTDLYSPGIHVLFDLKEKDINYTLNDYLWGQCKIEDAAYDVSEVLGQQNEKSKIFLIPSSMKTGDILQILHEKWDFNRLCDGFYNLIEAKKLDYLFIDTHPGLNEEILLSMSISDILVMVLRPDQQDFYGTAVTMEVAQRLGVTKTFLMLNKVIDRIDKDDLTKKLQRNYKVPLAGILPQTEEMMFLESKGIFSLTNPKDPWSQEIRKVAEKIGI
ncbi:MAG: MinD/ParA family protein [Moorea sp. SIO2B7]|nr:MinD/ParA family protein [Moorena sp. SIO2B7]